MKGCLIVILVVAAIAIFLGIILGPGNDQSQKNVTDDKATKIARLIEQKVNTEGYTGCETRVIEKGDPGIVQCDLHFPAGTNSWTVRINTKGVAETFAQAARLASTIYYIGYSGTQRVCEYQYDCYSGRVKEKF